MTLRGAVQQLHYQQLRLGITTGAAAFNPLIQNSKMTARAHALTSKESYRSLTSVGCRPAIPPREGKLQAFAVAQAIRFTADRWTYSNSIQKYM